MTASHRDEIDLVQMTIDIARFFRKNLVVVSVFVVLGIASALIFGFTKSDVMQSKMVLFSDLLTKTYCEQIGKNLNSLIHNPENAASLEKLNLTPKDASQIRSVDIDFIPERSTDIEFENSTMLITAEFTNKQIVPKLQRVILDYFRNNEFVRIRVRHRKEYYQKMVERIQSEIGSMDSVKQLVLTGRNPSSRSGLAFVDPSEINKTIIDLYKDQVKFKNDLDVVDSIQIVEGFTFIERPPRLRTSLLILFGFLGGLFSSLIFIGLVWVIRNSNTSTT